MRLNKYLSSIGYCSRRQADQLITAGKIHINGRIAVLGDQVHPIDPTSIKKYYYLLHKPLGVVSTTSDPHGRPTVVDLIPSPVKLFPVGRLDINSTGLIILTNDGDFALKLTHPRYHLPKTYSVNIKGRLSPDKIHQLQTGVIIDGQITHSTKVKQINPNTFEIVLFEGRKRQIRLMCSALHLHVISLIRTKIGPISLGDLKPGQYRPLTPVEVNLLLPQSL